MSTIKSKKNLRYWKIVLGPWLNSFITAYYEKNLEIDLLLKNKKIIIPIQISHKYERSNADKFFVFFSLEQFMLKLA